MHRLAFVPFVALALPACAASADHTAAPPVHRAAAPSAERIAAQLAEPAAVLPLGKALYSDCVGAKTGENLVRVIGGTCLCYKPPWEGGVAPPRDPNEHTRTDFNGIFVCRPGEGTPPDPSVTPRFCPVTPPKAGDPCSVHDAMMRNGDCMYLAGDLRSIEYARCTAGVWRGVSDDERQREIMMRP